MKKPTKGPHLQALNDKQRHLIGSIASSEMIVIEGCAGTGKTFIVSSLAAQYLKSGEIKQIIFTRPVVPCGKSIGFLPGTLEEKLAPWVMPFMNVIKKYFNAGELEMFLKNGKLQVLPFEVMRGSSFDDAFVIMDEAQNSSPKEMQMFVTRIGQDSKIVIMGDSTQSDLKQDESGLEMVQRMVKENGLKVPVIKFSSSDIVRSGLCKQWVQAFESEHKLPSFIG